eukprot:s339_g14.t1
MLCFCIFAWPVSLKKDQEVRVLLNCPRGFGIRRLGSGFRPQILMVCKQQTSRCTRLFCVSPECLAQGSLSAAEWTYFRHLSP